MSDVTKDHSTLPCSAEPLKKSHLECKDQPRDEIIFPAIEDTQKLPTVKSTAKLQWLFLTLLIVGAASALWFYPPTAETVFEFVQFSIKFSKILGIALSVILILYVSWLVLWKAPKKQVSSISGITQEARFNLENEARKTIAQIVGGVLVLAGLYSAWRTVYVSEQSQITESYTKAIEQLGSDKLQIRLGAIYALERISKNSEVDHWSVMEVLTAYVREHAKWNEGEFPEAQALKKPAVDVQAVLDVLRRRGRSFARGEDDNLNLERTDLWGADLYEAHLELAQLSYAHLEQADMRKSYLNYAWLNNAFLQDSDLKSADLERAHLNNAQLQRADLREANLRGAHLDGADLSDADLSTVKGLTVDQIRSAVISSGTKVPEYVRTAAAEAVIANKTARASLSAPRKRAFQHKEKIESTYDRFDDETKVSLRFMRISGTASNGIRLGANFHYPTKTPKTPEKITFIIVSDADEIKFKEDSSRRLVALIDDKRVDLGQMARMFFDKHPTGKGFYEGMRLNLPYDTFLQLALAQRVAMRLGTEQIDLTENHLEALRDFVSRTIP